MRADAERDADIADLSRLFHTVRHLKPVQILGRLYFAWYRPTPLLREKPRLRGRDAEVAGFPEHSRRMEGPASFRFLNESRTLSFPGGWNDAPASRLWLYNLHYFEDLVAVDAGERAAWHRDLIDRWVRDNPPVAGCGWEPYPVSQRIGNWIKWALAGNELEPAWLESLALQAEYLSRRVEWHLLGNHVFENAKALVLAGCFFEGQAANRWLEKGLRILDRQLGEQVLADGGHFERSPMYHSLVLEGLLDLVAVSACYGLNRDQAARWRACCAEMLVWMRTMAHPDGEISFFNDAAFDISVSPESLLEYARRLDVRVPAEVVSDGVTLLEQSGYARLARGPMVALLDLAPLGPDYQPGHGHADTLSFELSVHGQRVLVNSGTSVYGVSEERLRQRGTAAHNTVEVDGENSSEVWSGFRVARRARPFDVSVRGYGEVWQVQGAHDGYRRLSGRVVHERTWFVSESELTVEDQLSGGFESAVACFHFHPEVDVTFGDGRGVVVLDDGRRVEFAILEGEGELGESTYHPEFGVSLVNRCLRVKVGNSRCRVVFKT